MLRIKGMWVREQRKGLFCNLQVATDGFSVLDETPVCERESEKCK